MKFSRVSLPSLATLCLAPLACGAIDFAREVRPILSEHCFACHGPDAGKRKSGLRLDEKESAFGKAESGEIAIVPGAPERSELIRRITTSDKDDVMPPPKEHKQLKPAQAALLKQWIKEGAVWTGHWAFQPVKQPAVPGTGNPIDAFVLQKLTDAGLQPSPEEEPARLLRRLSLDLTGLPPSVAEVDTFLQSAIRNPQSAIESAVDRLLASPHFGERMAVPWLDLARYGDTSGYHNDSLRDMWLWREWVIKAFNANKPFSDFTVEQLAGDLLPNATKEQQIASGFHRNVMTSDEGGIIDAEYLNLYVVDRVATTGVTWFGLTIACAQCHDHKYDPVTQRDFYQLYAFFHNVPENGKDGVRDRNTKPFLRLATPEQEQQLAALTADYNAADKSEKEFAKSLEARQAEWERRIADGTSTSTVAPPPAVAAQFKVAALPAAKRTAAQARNLQKYFRENIATDYAAVQKRAAAAKQKQDELEKSIPNTMVMAELETPRDTFMKMRGQYDKDGDKVSAGTPHFLPPLPPPANGQRHTRLDLARWIVSPENPLTARVAVNRFWAMLFGTGLVKTLNDFGAQGEWPSHPELLDWLAADFAKDWDIKRALKQMVLSATYRQSAAVTPALLARDAENRLLARGPRNRLDAEFVRDNALAIAGLLNPQIGGKSTRPAQPPGIWEINEMGKQSYEKSSGADQYRRGLYTYWRRSTVYPSMITFDAPTREFCVAARARTSTPLQSLVLMNDPVYVEAARAFAQRILAEGGADRNARLAFAWRTALSRPPTAQEQAILATTLDRQLVNFSQDKAAATAFLAIGDAPKPPHADESELAAWTAIGNVLLNLNETISN